MRRLFGTSHKREECKSEEEADDDGSWDQSPVVGKPDRNTIFSFDDFVNGEQNEISQIGQVVFETNNDESDEELQNEIEKSLSKSKVKLRNNVSFEKGDWSAEDMVNINSGLNKAVSSLNLKVIKWDKPYDHLQEFKNHFKNLESIPKAKYTKAINSNQTTSDSELIKSGVTI